MIQYASGEAAVSTGGELARPHREDRINKITVVTLPLPLRFGTVNCYLLQAGAGFLLIDTGPASQRIALEHALASAGCQPGNLRLIVLTHGDFDHTGNAAYLRDRFGTRIAMHADDAGMAEHGDMFWNRSSESQLMRLLAPLLFRFSRANRFVPDLQIAQGYDLSDHGFEARVISIPGHSSGSIGVLTADGDLFCGDLLQNVDEPDTNSIMDNPAACEASLERLQGFDIRTIYPGHGKPFPIEELPGTNEQGNYG